MKRLLDTINCKRMGLTSFEEVIGQYYGKIICDSLGLISFEKVTLSQNYLFLPKYNLFSIFRKKIMIKVGKVC